MFRGYTLVLAAPLAACLAGGLAGCGSEGSNALDAARRYPDAAVLRDAGRLRREAGVDAGQRPDTGVIRRDAAVDAGRVEYTFENVEPIVTAKCDECHGVPPNADAVRSLVRYQDLVAVNAVGQPIHELVAYRIFAASWADHPRGSEDALTEEEKEILLGWSETGALSE